MCDYQGHVRELSQAPRDVIPGGRCSSRWTWSTLRSPVPTQPEVCQDDDILEMFDMVDMRIEEWFTQRTLEEPSHARRAGDHGPHLQGGSNP
jgi:hypothetical protein